MAYSSLIEWVVKNFVPRLCLKTIEQLFSRNVVESGTKWLFLGLGGQHNGINSSFYKLETSFKCLECKRPNFAISYLNDTECEWSDIRRKSP